VMRDCPCGGGENRSAGQISRKKEKNNARGTVGFHVKSVTMPQTDLSSMAPSSPILLTTKRTTQQPAKRRKKQ